MKIAFLDRDGVINEFPGNGNYVTKVKDFHFIPGSLEAIKQLTDAGYTIFVVSNQAGVGKGVYSKNKLDRINKKMLKGVKEVGGKIKEVYYCTCRSDAGCENRKPGIGSILKGLKKVKKDKRFAKNTFFVGDTVSDIVAGQKAGCKTIFVLSGRSDRKRLREKKIKPDFIANNLLDATKILFKRSYQTLMKILLIHASAGAGHTSAAKAIHHGLKQNSQHDVHIVDGLDYASPFFKKLYSGTYTFLISKIPWFWGFVFALLDIGFLQPLVRGFRRLYNALNLGGLNKYLVEQQFDVIYSTHFMPNEVVSALKRKNLIQSQLISVVTDFDVHKIWIADGVNQYSVATQWTKDKLIDLGVSDLNVHVTGIPTDKKFAQTKDKVALKEKLGLKDNTFTVLVATGSFGIGPIEELTNKLDGFQVVVVCGHNKQLFERMSQTKKEMVKVCGLVDNMDELMAVADVMVTKPGGLSISEALVSELPMIFFNAIPGQETNNIKVLKEFGVGISQCSLDQIVEHLNEFKADSKIFEAAVQKTKDIAQPQAVEKIISIIS